MFQLMYLTFTAPRADPVAFGVLTDQLKVTLANQSAMPDTVFDEALDAALSQNHLRAQPLTPARLDQMNLDKSLAFYKDRFADASDFTFVFVGSFDLATMKPLVERYLGSLPALRRNEAAKDVGMHPPAGVVEKQVKSGIAAAEPGQHRVQRGVRERRDASSGRQRRWAIRSRGNLQTNAAGGPGRHLRRQRRAELHEASDGGVSPDHQFRLRPGSHGEPRQDRVPGDRRSSRGSARARDRSPTRARR